MTIVMTGGAGFLGVHLLREQLRADKHVTVIAHGDATATRNRIQQFLPDVPTRRLAVVTGDIGQERLGLSEPVFRRLVASAEEFWHVAARIVLHGQDDGVRHTNITGTANVLRFLDATPEEVPLRYVSTAFVAGTLDGVVKETDTAAVTEFENTYEASKHTAEASVRRWATTRGRRAVCLRPSVLVPDRSGRPTPEHTMATFLNILQSVANAARQDTRLVLRTGADPRAHLNLLPVDWAAKTMLRICDVVDDGKDVPEVHVVHPHDVPARTISAALEDRCRVRLRMMPARPAQPTIPERLYYGKAAGFLPYLYHRRTFDDSLLRGLLPELAQPPRIDRAFLSQGLIPFAKSTDAERQAV